MRIFLAIAVIIAAIFTLWLIVPPPHKAAPVEPTPAARGLPDSAPAPPGVVVPDAAKPAPVADAAPAPADLTQPKRKPTSQRAARPRAVDPLKALPPAVPESCGLRVLCSLKRVLNAGPIDYDRDRSTDR
jgi:hypothetical protein